MASWGSDNNLDSSASLTSQFSAALESERLFALSNDLMCTAGIDGFFQRINPAFSRTLGYTEDELLGRPFIEFVHPDDRASTLAEVQRLSDGQATLSFQNRYACKNGVYKRLCWNAVPIVDASRILAVARDLTGESETRAALQRANELLAAVSRAQSLAIENQNAHGLFDDLLQVLLDLTHSEFGFIGEVFYDRDGQPFLRTHAITNISWDDHSRKFYQQNASRGFEFRNLDTLFGLVLRSGAAVISNDPIDDPRRGGIPAGHPQLEAFIGLPFLRSGEMIGMVGMANRPGGYNDEIVTFLEPVLKSCTSIVHADRMDRERLDQERRLRESEERYDLAVQGSSDGIWDWNVLTDDVYYSPRFKELLGYTEAEMEDVFGEWESRLHPDDHDATLAAVQSHLDSHTPYDVEYRVRTKTGHYSWFRARGQAVWDKDGRPARMAGSITDINDQKAAEEKLAEANARLTMYASTDSLTGLANRSKFDSKMENAWQQHQDEETILSLLLLDVDCFKEYNDSLGHLAGDECLKVIAEVIQDSLHFPDDVAARYGGEEFAVILPLTDAIGAVAVARRILERVRAEGVAHPRSRVDSVVTLSIGGATTGGPRSSSVRDFIHEADTALYKAKKSGRNRCEMAGLNGPKVSGTQNRPVNPVHPV